MERHLQQPRMQRGALMIEVLITLVITVVGLSLIHISEPTRPY